MGEFTHKGLNVNCWVKLAQSVSTKDVLWQLHQMPTQDTEPDDSTSVSECALHTFYRFLVSSVKLHGHKNAVNFSETVFIQEHILHSYGKGSQWYQ
jgi:hypothetical protein